MSIWSWFHVKRPKLDERCTIYACNWLFCKIRCLISCIMYILPRYFIFASSLHTFVTQSVPFWLPEMKFYPLIIDDSLIIWVQFECYLVPFETHFYMWFPCYWILILGPFWDLQFWWFWSVLSLGFRSIWFSFANGYLNY